MSGIVFVEAWGPNPGSIWPTTTSSGRGSPGDRAVLLPVDDDLIDFPLSGADGWAKREFGSDGIRPSSHVPSRCCPIAIRADPGRGFVCWALLLRFPSGEAITGSLRVGPDTSQRGTIAPAARPHGPPVALLAAARDAARYREDTWPVFGSLAIDLAEPGFVGLSVFGAATGVRISKIAVSICSREGAFL